MRLAAATTIAATILAADAGLETRAHAGLVSRLHHHALARSAGLARDLRVALRGLLADPPRARTQKLQARSGAQKTFCVPRVADGSAPAASSAGAGTSAAPSATASSSSSSKSQSASATKTASSSSGAASSTAAPSSAYKVVQTYTGNDFWNEWDFFTAADPTGGIVTFVDGNTAQSSGLAYVTANGSAVMAVDTTPVVSGTRKSIRIQSQFTFTQGLVLLDASHMPHGCGTWPAFWTDGPNWPAGGEIDIVEGVHAYTENQVTIHTSTGCTIGQDAAGSSGTLVSVTNCDAYATGNQGCGIRDQRTNSYGAGFNGAGGGVYAMLWDDDGIRVWFFQRSQIPSDISSGAPAPDAWGTPVALYPASSCNPGQFFHDHTAIFDTTLCGVWASGVWNTGNTAGQGDSCAAQTGVATCEEYVLNNGGAFSDAFWEVNYVKIFQHK